MKKSNKTNWKKLTRAQEKKVIADYEAGAIHNQILRKYNIPAGQFYSIIKKTASNQ